MKIKEILCRHRYEQLTEWENFDGVKKRVLRCIKCGKCKIVEKLPKPLRYGRFWMK